jgi:4-amino-4-deoxy-L-arabinose transferase-like glycosyltransferase
MPKSRKKIFWQVLPAWFRTYGLIFLISLASRLIFFNFFRYTPWIYNDEPGYLLGSRAILAGEIITKPEFLNFPVGYSLFLLPAVVLTKNPIWQYRIGLLITAVLASLVPVVVYYFGKKLLGKKALLASLLVSFHPTLFVYSGALMSEVSFTFILVLLVFSYFFYKLNPVRVILLTFLLILLSLIRSAGVVVAIAFYASWLIELVTKRKPKSLAWFAGSLLFFLGFSWLDSNFWHLRAGHYQGSDYFERLLILAGNPYGALRLFFNHLLVFVFMLFGLCFLWPRKIKQTLRNNLGPIIFTGLLVSGNILLATVHCARQYLVFSNLEYLLSFRYLAPYAAAVYSLGIVFALKSWGKLRANWWLFLVYAVALVVFFQNQGWKFANNVSVIFLANRANWKIILLMLAMPAGAMLLHKLQVSWKTVAIGTLIVFGLLIWPSRNGPRFAKDVYESQINFEKLTSPNRDINLFLNKYLRSGN